MPERLQKILAQAGYGSWRVNGQLASLGQKADPALDKITFDGRPIAAAEALTYIALYKPRIVLSTVERERGDERQIVRDLLMCLNMFITFNSSSDWSSGDSNE